MTELAFEHFDPEFELGNLDINGKPIKPRKKPGRKPNPPSPAQRKAQNRAAQRAFRERKRREMKDAETNIKKCLHMRDQAIKDAKRLQTKVDELIYENNFLKGQLLNLKITCIANRVDVPKFWDTGRRDKMGGDTTTFSRTKDIPQALEFFLDSKKHIISSTTDNTATYDTPPSSDSPEVSTYHQNDPPTVTAPQHEQQQHIFEQAGLVDSLLPQSSNPLSFFNLDELIQTASHSDMDPMLMQYLMQPDIMNDMMNQMKDVPPELWLTMMPPELAALIPAEIKSYLSNPHSITEGSPSSLVSDSTSPPPQVTPMQPTSNYDSKFKPEIPVEEDFWLDIKNPTISSSMSSKVYVAGPISPLDAVNQMRTMRDQNDNRYLLTPTELQRKIPHDPRIDLIPGPTMRDFMIIFQDFYDANELFNYLISTAVFIGGELGNQDCWFVPPNFVRKYWFLCPNHRPTRPDNSVEIAVFFAQKMIDTLKRRKEMYIMRDKHLDQFLPPTMDAVQTDELAEDDEQTPTSGSSGLECDQRLDFLVINTINKDIPRIISPNAFTV